MTNFRGKHQLITATAALGLVFLLVTCYFIVRPALQTKKLLEVFAEIQVGETKETEFSKMASLQGLRMERHPGAVGMLQRNRILQFLHLAPLTSVVMEAKVEDGVITVLSVRASIEGSRQSARISIDEFDSNQTGCGDLAICVKPFSSTNTTSVFFRPSVPAEERKKLLSLNAWCLTKLGGCENSREFLPVAWEHDNPSR